MITSYDIIKNLLRTEKTTDLEAQRKYAFKVAKSSNKPDVKRAVEEIYKVKVQDVNIINVPGKKKRVRKEYGYSANWKKAVVTLLEGHTIEVS